MNTSKIGMITGGILIGCAVLTDSIDGLLGLGMFGFIVDIPAALFFGICFSHNNLSMLHPDRALKFLGTIVVEATPASIVSSGLYSLRSFIRHSLGSVSKLTLLSLR